MTFGLVSTLIAISAISLTGHALAVWALAPHTCTSNSRPTLGGLILHLSMAAAGGLAIWSAAYTATLFAVGSDSLSRLAKDVLLSAVGLLACVLCNVRHRNCSLLQARIDSDSNWATRIYGSVFLIAFLLTIAAFWVRSAWQEGSWDAWAIWNLRARFLARGGDAFAIGFSPILSRTHPDYPLLLPGIVAGGWLAIGQESNLVPIGCALVFLMIIVSALVGGVSLLKTPCAGYVAGIVLLGTPFLIGSAPTQCADVPLAAYQLLACVTFALASESSNSRSLRLLVVCGCFAGAAAWTKNEGLVFFVSLATGITIAALLCGAPLARVRKCIMCYLVGASPFLLLSIYFKAVYAPPNDLVDGMLERIIGQSVELERHLTIIREFKYRIFDRADRWNYFAIALPFFVAASRCRSWLPPSILSLTITIGLVGSACYAAYIISPHDLEWHLATSLDRLILQVWPIAVLIAFLSVRCPRSCSKYDASDSETGAGSAIVSVGEH